MEFAHSAHEAAYQKVTQYLQQLFGEMAHADSDRPVFIFPAGSTMAHVAVTPWGNDDATVVVRAYVVAGADLTPELLTFLLRENDNMRFGAFGLDSDGDIFFEHTIVGSTLDKEELKASVLAVSHVADTYDDQLTARWGGIRTIDRMKGSFQAS